MTTIQSKVPGYRVWKPWLTNVYASARIGDGTVIGAFAEIGDEVEIGENCKIGAGAFIPKGVTIGDNVFIGPYAVFSNDKHPKASGAWKITPTYVEEGASIGANSSILCGVTIGKHARIGMGSVVTHDVPDGETWCGNPARRINKIT